MYRRIAVLGSIAFLLSFPAFGEEAVKPDVPILIIPNEFTEACPGSGIVQGLNPRGDGFLAVKSAPYLEAQRIDKLYNGEMVYLCNQRGDWFGIVYSRTGQMCRVLTTAAKTLPYTGPCRSGWAHIRYIGPHAGGYPPQLPPMRK